MGLLAGDGAGVFNSIFTAFYLDATVYMRESFYDDGGDLVIVEMEYDAKAQVDSLTDVMRKEEGASSQDRRIIILSGSTSADINTDSEIIVNAGPYSGVRFQIASIDRDPCGAYWSCRGRRAS